MPSAHTAQHHHHQIHFSIRAHLTLTLLGWGNDHWITIGLAYPIGLLPLIIPIGPIDSIEYYPPLL